MPIEPLSFTPIEQIPQEPSLSELTGGGGGQVQQLAMVAQKVLEDLAGLVPELGAPVAQFLPLLRSLAQAGASNSGLAGSAQNWRG